MAINNSHDHCCLEGTKLSGSNNKSSPGKLSTNNNKSFPPRSTVDLAIESILVSAQEDALSGGLMTKH